MQQLLFPPLLIWSIKPSTIDESDSGAALGKDASNSLLRNSNVFWRRLDIRRTERNGCATVGTAEQSEGAARTVPPHTISKRTGNRSKKPETTAERLSSQISTESTRLWFSPPEIPFRTLQSKSEVLHRIWLKLTRLDLRSVTCTSNRWKIHMIPQISPRVL